MQNRQIITVTNIIIVFTVFMYIVQNIIPYGSIRLGLNRYFLEADLWYQPLSTIFVHGSIMHILMNMFVFYQFGNLVEKFRGVKTLLVLYFIGGVITSLLSFAFIYYIGLNHNLVGASGALCVILGYVAYIDKYQRKGIIIWILLISFAPLLLGLPIGWYAHLFGLALGYLYGVIKGY